MRHAKIFIPSLTALLLCVGMTGCGSQTESRDISTAESRTVIKPSFDVEALEADIEALMAHYDAPGLAIGILENAQPVYEAGFGFRELETGLPVTPETRFRAGSVTKQFTAGLVGIRVDEGVLALSDHPSNHLPGLMLSGEVDVSAVDLRDLLTHTSGFGNLDGTLVFFPVSSQDDLLRRVPHLPLLTPSGEEFAYSNMGYTLAGVIAAPDGFDVAVQTDILEPLEMTRSGMDFDLMSEADDVAHGYTMVEGSPAPVIYENMRLAGPSGGLNTTASDLAHWVSMWLNEGRYGQKNILSSEFVEQATTRRWPKEPRPEGENSGYGYGFFIDDLNGLRRVSHGGNTAGFSSLVDFLPERSIGLAVMTNQQNSDIVYHVADLVYAHILGQEKPDIAAIETRITEGRIENPVGTVDPQNPPTWPLEDMDGEYHHAGYGVVTIRRTDGHLVADFPDFTIPLRHSGGNEFVLNWVSNLHQNIPEFTLEFLAGEDGTIESFRLPLRLGNEVFVANTNHDPEPDNRP